MTQFAITVTGNQAVRTHQAGILPAGMTGAAVTVTFDEAWEGLQRMAVFRCGKTVVDVPMADTAAIPPKALLPDEKLYLGLYGTDGTTTVIPTVWVELGLVEAAADPSGDESTDPTLPIWATLQAQIDGMEIPEDVLRSAPQTLTQAQQTQARANMGAAAQTDMDALGLTPIPGKNLFDVAAVTLHGWADYSSGKIEMYPDNKYIQNYSFSDYMPVIDGESYTYSNKYSLRDGRTYMRSWAWYDQDKKYISGTVVNGWMAAPTVLTAPANAAYIILNFMSDEYDKENQFEQGETITDYAPYGPSGKLMAGAKVPLKNVVPGSSLLHLPEKYHLVVGDTFELFYKGVMLCKDPYAYNLLVSCDIGNAYSRKFSVTPTEPGDHTLTLQVTDDFGNVLDSGSTHLVVAQKMAAPAENINVLCLGDSLTAGGVWVDELYRRLTKTTAVTQYNAAAPTGDGLKNITFIGKKTTANGAGFEGTGGWTYGSYLDAAKAGNPFAYNGKVDFSAYCADLGVEKIHRCYILLGWNMAATAESAWKADAKALMDLLLAHNPAMKIVLLGLQIPALDGLGTNYGATGTYANYRALQEYVFSVDKWNKALAAEHPGNVSWVSIAGQFDTEYNMPVVSAPVNLRSTAQTQQQNNGVHPAPVGYYQIADAVYRQFHS